MQQLIIMKKQTIIEQYLSRKKEFDDDIILFFQIGEFFEIFFDDAKLVAGILDLHLTSKKVGGDEVPMCGVPIKAADAHIQKLLKHNKRVAVIKQVVANNKVVDRKVEQVHTSGTTIDTAVLSAFNNFLASIYFGEKGIEAYFVDVSTNESFLYTGIDANELESLFKKYDPKEILSNDKNFAKVIYVDGKDAIEMVKNYLGFIKSDVVLDEPKVSIGKMDIEANCLKNLEIFESLSGKSNENTLFETMDFCKTDMGKRQLLQFLALPLIDVKEIIIRQDKVKLVMNVLDDAQNILCEMPDIERLTNRLASASFGLMQLFAVRKAVEKMQQLKSLLQSFDIPDLSDCINFFDSCIVNDSIIQSFDNDFDTASKRACDALEIMTNYVEATKKQFEQKAKLSFVKSVGYFLEIPSKSNKLPFEFRVLQTTGNITRYTSDKLSELSTEAILAQGELDFVASMVVTKIKEQLSKFVPAIKQATNITKQIDVFCSLAQAAKEYNLICPIVDDSGVLYIKNGRHLVVEKSAKFISNDTNFDDKTKIMLITGANMGGKSTYMRQVALIVVLAQIGSFVPASEAHIGIVDKIFTRIGAGDDIASGLSTFMTEMKEVANILKNATKNSLIVLDEIGRGTSSTDGIAIAKGVVDYSSKLNAKTMFATHFFELSSLDKKYQNLKNFCFDAKLNDDKIVFDHKLQTKASNNSYGIEIAALAGLPNDVTTFAKRTKNDN